MFESKTEFNSSSKDIELINIFLFSFADCISLLGTSAYNFAISLYVLKITKSGLSFATTLILGVFSVIIVTPFAGVLADKLNKRLISITADITNGVLLIFLFLLINTGYSLSLSMIYISTFLLNFFTTIYGVCIEASKPNLVSENKLISINSINTVINSSSSILGPIIGGLIFAIVDIKYFILLNGISFIISALLHMFMNFKLNYNDIGKNNETINFYIDLKEVVTYLKKQKNLIDYIIIFVALNFFIGLSINVPLPYLLNNVFQLDNKLYGIVQSAFSIGMILGAVMIKRIIEKYSHVKIIKYANILLSASMTAIGFSVIICTKTTDQITISIYFILIMILAGLAISFIDIPLFYHLQKTIPDEFRGRVLSISISISKTVLPVTLIISGALINYIPSCILPIIGGIMLCIFTLSYIKN